MSVFIKNPGFGQKIQVLVNFFSKFQFCSKIPALVKNNSFGQKLVKNPSFSQKLVKNTSFGHKS